MCVAVSCGGEGVLNSFLDGVDVLQTTDYISITCESYIDKLLTHYSWASAGTRESGEKLIEPIAMSQHSSVIY
jgi:hypothetical protein